ncbi:hypothetical protein SDC9_185950 [bioreactor metagenome]|uniref:Uncharacterized protein n=1 Tax=bioreactor metagenome TaxID=1076179 RepID=A0A645HII7_9ZZZZ
MRHQHGLKVIAVQQTRTNSRNNGIDVFKDGSQLNANHIARNGCFQDARTYGLRKFCRFLNIIAGNGQERESLKRHFFCVARAGYHPDILLGNLEIAHQVFADHNIVVRDHAFNGRNHELPFQRAAHPDFSHILLHKR